MRRVEKGESRRQRLCGLVPNTNKFIFRNKAYIKDIKNNRHNKIFKDEYTKKNSHINNNGNKKLNE